ncbi:hypothetical protein FH972_025581 [Carpinus fangiana]|uniref:PLC-like phosphodiesterase n=1 Tax=Carpinus fangiana TaxID=176857 RepID=A0A5N6L1E9_9ROSI|nr:hypothetical protein FH972_025581 [Carpinus fangiana]
MQWHSFFLAAFLAVSVGGQSSATDSTTATSLRTPTYVAPPTGSYASYTGQVTADTSARSSTSSCSGSSCPSSPTGSQNATGTGSSSSTTNTLLLQGSNTPVPTGMNTTTNMTASSTSSSAVPTNTQPCNNYPEFCSKRYMNVTEVCAHNSAFTTPNNAARNQDVVILGQLNDGIRMIQGETQYVNDTIYSCHTSCDLLNAGTLEAELTTVRRWVAAHPYDVITILLVNTDRVDVNKYTAPIMDAGLGPYLYEPPKIPMHRDDWPTYGEMILSGKRVVVFMDYNANQTEVPYVLDQFSQMWETPFSPTDINFPCDQQRPPGLNAEQQDLVPYLANHNLNVEINLGSFDLLIPNFAQIGVVNANNDSTGSLLNMANDCTAMWGRPPAWLLVDFYDVGDGSVFEVAAKMNNVTYSRPCCGQTTSVSAASGLLKPSLSLVAGALGLLFALQ